MTDQIATTRSTEEQTNINTNTEPTISTATGSGGGTATQGDAADSRSYARLTAHAKETLDKANRSASGIRTSAITATAAVVLAAKAYVSQEPMSETSRLAPLLHHLDVQDPFGASCGQAADALHDGCSTGLDALGSAGETVGDAAGLCLSEAGNCAGCCCDGCGSLCAGCGDLCSALCSGCS